MPKDMKRFGEKRRCITCYKIFYVKKKGNNKGISSFFRPRNAKTCSRECSRKKRDENKSKRNPPEIKKILQSK